MTDAERLIDDMFKAKKEADDMLLKNLDKVSIVVGDYAVWNVDEKKVGVTDLLTGEAGIFEKADIQPYIKLFFNTHF